MQFAVYYVNSTTNGRFGCPNAQWRLKLLKNCLDKSSGENSGKNLFENQVSEKDIWNWLDKKGFFGKSTKLYDLELHVLKRPGWLQVFRFSTSVKNRESGNSSGGVDGAIQSTGNLIATRPLTNGVNCFESFVVLIET